MANLTLDGALQWRLGARTRKGVLVVHIVSAGVWIGIDVVMAVVIFTALLADEESTKALCYRALELFAVWPLLTAGLVCLASGVVLGLGTKYGLTRYWWVAIKLALNIVLTALVPIALLPEVTKAAEQGWRFEAGEPATLVVGNLIFPPIVSPTALLIAVVLAVFKPWGESVSARRHSKTHDEQRQRGGPRVQEVLHRVADKGSSRNLVTIGSKYKAAGRNRVGTHGRESLSSFRLSRRLPPHTT